jgi:hypothetical protein
MLGGEDRWRADVNDVRADGDTRHVRALLHQPYSRCSALARIGVGAAAGGERRREKCCHANAGFNGGSRHGVASGKTAGHRVAADVEVLKSRARCQCGEEQQQLLLLQATRRQTQSDKGCTQTMFCYAMHDVSSVARG